MWIRLFLLTVLATGCGSPLGVVDDRATATPRSPSDREESCLESEGRHIVELRGSVDEGFEVNGTWEPGTRVDAREARFIMPYPGSEHPRDPFTVENVPGLCLSGGVYSAGIPDDEPDWELYHHSQGIYLKYVSTPIVENVAILESGDGVRFSEGTAGWTFRDSYVQHTGDDTVETDFLYPGTIQDVLVDWTFVFLSCRMDPAERGAGHPPGGTVVVENSMVALRPQRGAYKSTDTGGRFFKWEKHDTPGCTLALHDNIFLVADGEYADLHLDPGDDQDIAYDVLLESSGNIIVWLGDGAYPEPIPEGFTITRDVGVWDAAREAWFDRHAHFEEFR